jgi:TolB-like protein/Flp pilus assembly protein TadD
MPFKNLSDDPSQERLADAMTEDLITDLSGIAGARVIASNTAFSYRGRQIAAQSLKDELGVDYVLQGSVRRRGDELRVNAQLVDAATAFQIWAHRYDRPARETFAVQDELTREIVATLAIQLSPQEQTRLARQPTNNLVAYDHFQEGQRLGKVNTKETNLEAQAAYRRAIEADPTYGRAYGALAYTLAYNFRRGWNDSPMQTIDRALELALRGVELDGSIPQTFWSLGYVHLMRKEFAQAETSVMQALDISPSYADGFGLLALIDNVQGDAEAAIANIRKGMQLNPYYTWDYPYNLGRAYYILGEYDKAIEELEKAKARNPNVMPVRLVLAASYVRAGRKDDALWEIEEVQTINPFERLSHLAGTLATNDEESLQRFLQDLREAGLPE